MEITTITMAVRHGYKTGDIVQTVRPDYRWWMRLWHWVLMRPRPVVTVVGKITSVDLNTFTYGQPSTKRKNHDSK